MANVNSPFGLRPIKAPGGGEPKIHYYKVTSGCTLDIEVGVPMRLSSNGFAYPLGVTTAASQLGNLGAAAEQKAGSSATRSIAIWDDPDQEFLAQSIMTTAIAQTHVGNNMRIMGATAPYDVNTTNDMATCGINGVATTAAAVRIMGLWPGIKNAFGAYAKLVVRYNPDFHIFGSRATGV